MVEKNDSTHRYGPLLWNHQYEAVAKALPMLQTRGGFYLAHDVGTGKTLTATVLARLLKAQNVLVITTVNGIAVWQRELKKWWPECFVSVLHQNWGKSTWGNGPSVTVTTYEQLIDVTWTKADGTVVKGHGEQHLRLLLRDLHKQPTLLVLDESHKAKSPSAKISRAMWKLEQAARWRLRMSGSPQHSMLDLWAQYRYLVPDEPLFQLPFREFKDGLVTLGGPSGNWVVGWKDEGKDTVARTIEPFTHAVDAAVLELPEPVYNVIPFELSPVERKAYDEMETDLAVEFEDGSYAEATIILAKALRLQQITSGYVPTNEEKLRHLGTSKLHETMELIEARPRRKIIVGCRFTEDLNRLELALTGRGRFNLRVDGSVSPARRGQIEDTFQHSEEPIVLLIQEATATAITLTAASTVIPYSITPRVIDWMQFLGRAYRGGQTKYLEILVPCAEDTVDEDIYNGVREKADDANMARILRDSIERRAHAG